MTILQPGGLDSLAGPGERGAGLVLGEVVLLLW
jgi:hypothetical protein